MVILGIETSCDETAAAVLEGSPSTGSGSTRIQILSNVVASSSSLQAKYGGVIPEQAAREQIKSIIPVIEETLRLVFDPEVLDSEARTRRAQTRRASLAQGSPIGLDAIAVTYGPGLIGSLLVGVETAKTLALVWNKPLIPVNHLIGHFYANWIESTPPTFPCLGLLVSGGHTDLVLFTDHSKYKYLGGTRDDAAGECFDKCARLLGLPYPGGPEISKLAKHGHPQNFKLPIPMKGTHDFDFSYSGLKTAVANLVRSSEFVVGSEKQKADLAATIESAIVESLVEKVIQALKVYPVKNVMIAGGVAANQKLVQSLQSSVFSLQKRIKLHIPPANLCTDNAAMIAAAGFFERKRVDPLKLQADPSLSLT